MTGLKKCFAFFFLCLNRRSVESLQGTGVEEKFAVFQKWVRGWNTIEIRLFRWSLMVQMKPVWMEFLTTLFQLS